MKKYTDSEKVIANIRDSLRYLEIKGIQFVWKYTIESHYKLFTLFNFQSATELEELINKQDALTLLKVFYCGIKWDAQEVPFDDFVFLFDSPNDGTLESVAMFINDNLSDFLNVKKKKYILITEEMEKAMEKKKLK